MTVTAKKMKRLGLCILITLCFSNELFADTLELATLEWPPFSGSNLPENGINGQIISQALSYENHTLAIAVFPWNRAYRTVKTGQTLGYFPKYLNPSSELLFSDAIGVSPIVLLERKNHPIKWHVVSDLNRYTLGVINGFINTEEIDEMILNGSQPSETASDEKQNILKLAAGRIDAILIDAHVYQYLASTDPQVANVAQRLQINAKIIEHKSLHVAFIDNPQGKKWRDIINNGLAKFDPLAMQEALLPFKKRTVD